MNTNLILIAVILVSVYADAKRDSLNEAKYKRPHSHWPWPLLDVWHFWKKVSVGVCWIFLWSMLWPNYYIMAALVPVSWLLWRYGSKSAHWRR